MDKTVFMFPGQGSQYVGMGRKLYEEDIRTRKIYIEAEEILGFPLRDVTFSGPEDKLRDTRYAQPALFVLEVCLDNYVKSFGLEPDIVIGHSLGEFSALYSAGVADFITLLKLVKRRGELMSIAGGKQKGGMAAVIGLPLEKLKRTIGEIEGCLEIANLNSPEQVVVSGETKAIESIIEKAKERGAKRVIPLNVSAAFHSSLMDDIVNEFSKMLEEVELSPPKCSVIPNVTGTPTTSPEEIKTCLKKQLRSSVLFWDSLQNAKRDGGKVFIEIGPGNVLSKIARRNLESIEVLNIENPEDMGKIQWLSR